MSNQTRQTISMFAIIFIYEHLSFKKCWGFQLKGKSLPKFWQVTTKWDKSHYLWAKGLTAISVFSERIIPYWNHSYAFLTHTWNSEIYDFRWTVTDLILVSVQMGVEFTRRWSRFMRGHGILHLPFLEAFMPPCCDEALGKRQGQRKSRC